MKTRRRPTREVMTAKCATCPFREGSPHEALAPMLAKSCLEGSRQCHSTGTNALNGRTGVPARICRGSRDIQLKVMHAAGVLTAPTDEAWKEAAL